MTGRDIVDSGEVGRLGSRSGYIIPDGLALGTRRYNAGTVAAIAQRNHSDASESSALVCVALYARVSSHDQRTDLDRQLARLSTYAAANNLHVIEAAAEVGSGLNGKRRKLLRILGDPKIGAIVVEHRDRFARFGSEYLEAALAAAGRRLIVVDATEMNDDLGHDMIAILTSFCARLYGRRGARNRAKSIESALASAAAS